MSSFTDLGVPTKLAAALADLGITTPFPIQAATLPDSLAGRDVLGRGRTGSGKTYAFALPVLARLAASQQPAAPRPPARADPGAHPRAGHPDRRGPRPAGRGRSACARSPSSAASAPSPQINGLRAGVDVLVACPGRLLDHLQNGHASLDAVEITVLDEADHMADLGFLPVVRRLMDADPAHRASGCSSRPPSTAASTCWSSGSCTSRSRTASTRPPRRRSRCRTTCCTSAHDDRFPVLVDLLAAPGRSLVFTRTKRRAKVLTRQLVAAGVPAVELHGNLAQNARSRNLSAFSDGSAPTLVATDIAARGIHVDDVALVIHADPPVEHKAYLHRSGRTARAGAQGTVITLMTDDQQGDVRDLTRKAGIRPTTTRPVPATRCWPSWRRASGRSALRRPLRPHRSGRPADGRTAGVVRPGAARPATSSPAPATGRGGQGRPRRGGSGSTPVHSTQSRSAGSGEWRRGRLLVRQPGRPPPRRPLSPSRYELIYPVTTDGQGDVDVCGR